MAASRTAVTSSLAADSSSAVAATPGTVPAVSTSLARAGPSAVRNAPSSASRTPGGVTAGPPGQRALGEHGAEAAVGDDRSEASHGRGVGWARRERPGGVLGDEPPPVVQGVGEPARGRRTWHGAQRVDAGDRSQLIAALLHQFEEWSDHVSAAGRAARRPLQLLGGPQPRDDRRRREHVVDEATK